MYAQILHVWTALVKCPQMFTEFIQSMTRSFICSGDCSGQRGGVLWGVTGHRSQVRSQLRFCCLAWGTSAAHWGRSFYRNSCNINRLQQIKGLSIKSPTLAPLEQAIRSNILPLPLLPCEVPPVGYNSSRIGKMWVLSLATVFPDKTSLVWAPCRATAPNGCHELVI